MAVDYSILSRVPSIGSRIISGMEAGREAAIRNQLLARQNQQFEQAQEDRRRALQREQQQDAAYEQIAGVLRQAGQDPDNPAVLQQLTAAAFQSRNPQVISAVSLMTERAAKRRQAAEARARVAAIMGGQPPGAPPAPAAAAAPLTEPPAQPTVTQTTMVEPLGARPERRPPVLSALPQPVEKVPEVTFQTLPPVSERVGRNALAPATAVAAPVNAMTTPAANPRLAAIETEIDVKERQRAALLADGSPEAMKQAAALQADLGRLDREYQRLQPKQQARSEFFQLQEALSSLPPGDPRRKNAEARMAKLTKDEAEKRPRVAPVTLSDGTLGSMNLDTGEITPGVIAGQKAKGKPSAAQEKAGAQATARSALSKDLQTVLGYYEQLHQMGGMVSPERLSAENIIASVRTSGVGQTVERTVGTKAQTLRDNISNSRQRLFSHIKNATGASAQQMNSNVELQTWLNALTNPSQSIETVRETLGQLDAVIAGVRNQVDRESNGARSPVQSAPASGNRREIAPGVFVTERP
jgi:hypothetical protein